MVSLVNQPAGEFICRKASDFLMCQHTVLPRIVHIVSIICWFLVNLKRFLSGKILSAVLEKSQQSLFTMIWDYKVPYCQSFTQIFYIPFLDKPWRYSGMCHSLKALSLWLFVIRSLIFSLCRFSRPSLFPFFLLCLSMSSNTKQSEISPAASEIYISSRTSLLFPMFEHNCSLAHCPNKHKAIGVHLKLYLYSTTFMQIHPNVGT